MDFYKNPWFQIKTPNPMASMRLFCFPYAGGSANIYLDWAEHLPRDVEVIALQYPGRGHRFSEPLISNCDEMISQLVSHISPLLDKPFAFFGHSNGALISFELARALQKRGHDRQVHHFLSGRGPVQLPRRSVELLHRLPDDEFKRKLESLGGTPREFLESPELMEIFLPILRADFSLNETFVYRDDQKLNTNATVLYGLSDTSFAVEDMGKWSDVVNGDVDSRGYEGDHFFINSQRKDLLQFLNVRLVSILGRTRQARCYA
jgi:medium-chain acyl-[acyl-carrier-protein] hydrolase